MSVSQSRDINNSTLGATIKSGASHEVASQESSEVDELKELQMRTGLVQPKIPKIRMPALRKPGTKTIKKKMTMKSIKFADFVKADGKSAASGNNSQYIGSEAG